MSQTKVTWTGLTEYRNEVRQLPEACTGEAAKVVEGEVNGAYVEIAQVYGQHRHTGKLLKRLKITPITNKGALTTGRKLTSGSPIAWLFDNGSQARHWVSGKSTGKMWGRTPPTHIFTRTEGRTRARIVNLLKAMVLRRGATTVAGDE